MKFLMSIAFSFIIICQSFLENSIYEINADNNVEKITLSKDDINNETYSLSDILNNPFMYKIQLYKVCFQCNNFSVQDTGDNCTCQYIFEKIKDEMTMIDIEKNDKANYGKFMCRIFKKFDLEIDDIPISDYMSPFSGCIIHLMCFFNEALYIFDEYKNVYNRLSYVYNHFFVGYNFYMFLDSIELYINRKYKLFEKAINTEKHSLDLYYKKEGILKLLNDLNENFRKIYQLDLFLINGYLPELNSYITLYNYNYDIVISNYDFHLYYNSSVELDFMCDLSFEATRKIVLYNIITINTLEIIYIDILKKLDMKIFFSSLNIELLSFKLVKPFHILPHDIFENISTKNLNKLLILIYNDNIEYTLSIIKNLKCDITFIRFSFQSIVKFSLENIQNYIQFIQNKNPKILILCSLHAKYLWNLLNRYFSVENKINFNLETLFLCQLSHSQPLMNTYYIPQENEYIYCSPKIKTNHIISCYKICIENTINCYMFCVLIHMASIFNIIKLFYIEINNSEIACQIENHFTNIDHIFSDFPKIEHLTFVIKHFENSVFILNKCNLTKIFRLVTFAEGLKIIGNNFHTIVFSKNFDYRNLKKLILCNYMIEWSEFLDLLRICQNIISLTLENAVFSDYSKMRLNNYEYLDPKNDFRISRKEEAAEKFTINTLNIIDINYPNFLQILKVLNIICLNVTYKNMCQDRYDWLKTEKLGMDIFIERIVIKIRNYEIREGLKSLISENIKYNELKIENFDE